MNDSFSLFLVFLTGVGTGFGYFGGLLFTVRRIRSMQKPGLYLLGSFLLRTGLTAVIFSLVSNGEWLRLVACTLGFFCTRQTMIMIWRPAAIGETSPAGGTKWKS